MLRTFGMVAALVLVTFGIYAVKYVVDLRDEVDRIARDEYTAKASTDRSPNEDIVGKIRELHLRLGNNRWWCGVERECFRSKAACNTSAERTASAWECSTQFVAFFDGKQAWQTLARCEHAIQESTGSRPSLAQCVGVE